MRATETFQEWNAFKFVFKSYTGVVAPQILTALDRAETLAVPITVSGLSQEDAQLRRSLSFLLAQVFSRPLLQLMMNVGDQNGLEALRLLVRAEQPVFGANRIAAMQSILQYKFSPGSHKLEEELRTFEGLVKTYHAVFGEAISDSITQAVIKSQMPAEIRTHLELQTFAGTAELISLMSSLSKMRTEVTRSSSAGYGKGKEKGKAKGKSKEKGKEKPKSEKFEGWCTNCEKWSQKAANCWHGKEKQVHQIQGKAGTASSSSSRSALVATDEGTKAIGLVESVCEGADMSWLLMVADAVAINQLSMDGVHSLVVYSGAFAHVCPKSYATHATLRALLECWRGFHLRSASGKMLKVWSLREVVCNAMDLHGEVFTVKIPFVVCEVRRPLLSLAMLEDKDFHLTVKGGCWKLGGHGREMILRRQGNSNLLCGRSFCCCCCG